ncbi:MAG: choice-of-anchor D domain-containing protein [Deltaproteobacteria bacterium]|nr:choice-of-anchor D domain-containing protein [Deltaproteobacteria bacterium]
MLTRRGQSRAAWWLVCVAALAPACNCEGENVGEARPHGKVDAALDLGAVAVGLPASELLFLANDGTDTLVIRGFTMEGDQADAFSASSSADSVIPRSSATVEVTLRPRVEGPQSATLVIDTNATDQGPLRVALTGVGLPPAVRAEPAALDFGELLPGMSRSLVLTLVNTTATMVPVQLVLVDDATLAYSVVGGPLGGAYDLQVSGGARLAVTVLFAPTQGGVSTGTLRVDSCGNGCGVAVPLTGALRAPRLDIAPIYVDFGRLPEGGTADQSVTVTNRGSAPLTVDAAELGGTGAASFLVLTAVPFTLAPEESSLLDFRYSAGALGRSDARVSVLSNDPRTPEATLVLTGATTGADVVALPGVLQFGNVYDDHAHVRDVLVLNRGDQAADIVSLQPPDGAFVLEGQPPLPHLLGPSQSILLSVQFAAAPTGTYASQLVLGTTSPGDAVITVPMEATRVDRACRAATAVTELNFGAVRLAQQSRLAFMVRNDGTGPCVLAPPVPAPGYVSSPSFSSLGTGTTVQPGGAHRVEVVFAPQQRGVLRGVVQVGVAGAPAVLVSLRGRGTAGGVSANPPFVDFGRVPVGCGTSTRNVTLIADGAEVVDVQLPQVLPGLPFSVDTSGFPARLLPGAARMVSLTFAPGVEGVYTGELHIPATIPEPMDLVVGLRGEGMPRTTEQTEEFVAAATTSMDVLFVVDNSGSMQDNQENLSANMSRFIQVADFRTVVDYQLGLTTTDVSPDGEQGALVGAPAIITRASGDPVGAFTQRALVGVYGSGDEQGLEAARLALSPPLVVGHNRGFLRDRAGLAIIVVSDEEDGSPLPVSAYVDFFTGLKAASGAPVIINAITGQATGCDTGYPAVRYEAAVQATGGVSASICDPDWATKLRQVGEAALLSSNRFRLAGQPNAGTVTVTVNGTPVRAGWRYDPASNTVIFEAAAQPSPGARVVVSYQVQC